MDQYVIETMRSVFLQKPKVKKVRYDGDFLVVRDNNKKIVLLNSTARDIYEMCDGMTIGEVIEKMNSMYKVEKKRLSREILNFLRDMEKKGLVVLK